MNSVSAQGRLTTHILDTARGCPAAGVRIDLARIFGETRTVLESFVTNADGRVEGTLLAGEDMTVGVYELVFHAGDYLRTTSPETAGDLFLDLIPIRFGINKGQEHYHVPLLLSPFGYSTYRGS